MIPLVLAPVFLIGTKWISEQKALLVTLQSVALLISYEMLTHYRSMFSDVTWRNPDGKSEFWPLLHVERWIPNCIANQPEYLLVTLWILGTAFLAFCLYPRAKPNS
jgi:hypothetical protein